MKLIKDFECVPNGEIYPRVLPVGDECPAELEQSALTLGLVDPSAEEAAKAEAERLAAEETAKADQGKKSKGA